METDQAFSNNLKKPFLNNPSTNKKNVNGSLNVENEVASLPSISINIEGNFLKSSFQKENLYLAVLIQ